MDPQEEFSGAEVQEIKSYIQDGDLSGAIERIKSYLESLENATLNIAVTGESGTGKSTFINTFLDLSDEDGAKTGVVETTMKPEAYPHPKYRNVKYWDLPGIGTPNFKAEDYLHKVHFANYDFFIIIASERFRECNIHLAQAVQAMKKKFYFVRSKIGQEMYSSKKKKGKTFHEETILEEIREDCLKCFRKENINNPAVFLLDCLEKGKYDYDPLQEVMERELPKQKRYVFLMSLPNISLSALEKKMEALRQQIWKKATLSCAAAALPIPGLGIACDLTILVKTMREYQTVFGLDEGSLNKLCQLSGKSMSNLKSVIKSPQVIGELNKEIVIKMISKGTMGAVMLAEHLKSSIPMFGSLAAGGLSYAMTYKMLKGFLLESAQDAQRVLIKASEDQV
ncbi:interferon-inducible GTPase 5-like [Bufo bufo]|uniref:interferon-inducible GTPase 5-like n=1 Tax=Bufo bufo TaxID=8384 RepID=UPI001ABDEA74|nr:interferon-inducible GTPase 5-like [Bufo bufo]